MFFMCNMITLRCTRKLQKYLGVSFVENPDSPKAKLGDWYTNFIPTLSGDIIIFVSEKTLLMVAIPVWEADKLLPMFGFRVVNLLKMIGVAQEVIDKEIKHYSEIQFAKTASRSILGTMNEIAYHLQYKAEYAKKKEDFSLSNIELEMSNYLWKSLDYRYPSDIAKEILYLSYLH